ISQPGNRIPATCRSGKSSLAVVHAAALLRTRRLRGFEYVFRPRQSAQRFGSGAPYRRQLLVLLGYRAYVFRADCPAVEQGRFIEGGEWALAARCDRETIRTRPRVCQSLKPRDQWCSKRKPNLPH